MALVRGRTLVPLRAFVKETYGEPGWQRLLGELPPPVREILDGLVVPDAWYDRAAHVGLIEVSFRLWGSETPNLGRKMGGRVAKHHDRFYLRPLLKLGGPMAVVGRAASLYRDYFQGGEMSIVARREHGARVTLNDPHCPPQFCSETLLGFIEELIRLSGRKPVRVAQDVCRFAGATHCEMDIEWT